MNKLLFALVAWPFITYTAGIVILTPAFVRLWQIDEDVQARLVVPAVFGWPFWLRRLFG